MESSRVWRGVGRGARGFGREVTPINIDVSAKVCYIYNIFVLSLHRSTVYSTR